VGTKRTKMGVLSIALVTSVCCVLRWGTAQPAALAQSVPRSPQLPPTTPSLTLNELTIGKLNLFGDFWGVVNVQPADPGRRSELRLFPKAGTTPGQLETVGGEVSISRDDLYNLNSTGDYHVMSIYAYKEEYRVQSQAGGNANPYPIKFDSMGGFINFSLNTDGSLGIARGISNTQGAGGFAHQRVPSCTAQSCEVQVNWITGFGDANYTATCTLGGAPGIVNWTEKQPGFLVVTVLHLSPNYGGEIDCIGVHD
jgi:hypothetical protein